MERGNEMELINQLNSLFDQWNKENLTFKSYNDFIEITTPFVDMHHDLIQLYFTDKSDNAPFKLTDDGYIVNELKTLGINIRNTQKRKDFFEVTLRSFGINYDQNSNELFVTFDALKEYPAKQHNLLQCIIKITDMLLTSRNTVASIFTEEIEDYFEENNVIFTPRMGFLGKTGNQQTFDFIIPHSKKSNEKLIKAVNKATSRNYINTLFPFTDIQSIRKDSDLLVIANDLDSPISEKFKKSLTNWDVEVLPWTSREEWVERLQII